MRTTYPSSVVEKHPERIAYNKTQVYQINYAAITNAFCSILLINFHTLNILIALGYGNSPNIIKKLLYNLLSSIT